jgi:hypothetical protein
MHFLCDPVMFEKVPHNLEFWFSNIRSVYLTN